MEKYIIITLILLFGAIYYFDKQHDNKIVVLEQLSTLKIDKNKPKKRTWVKSITNAIKSKNRPDDGIRRVGSNKPDSDTSACVGWPKSDKDMITTKFAGYVLKYPCTVNQKGEYQTGYNSDGTLAYQRYSLYISVVLGQKNGAIWSSGINSSIEKTQPFRLALKSDGQKRSNKPMTEWIKSAEKIKILDEVNLIVFRKGNYVKAFIKDLFESKKPYVSISCDLTQDADPYELFSSFHNIGNKSLCTAGWKLTEDISLKILGIQSKHAYQFNMIYQEINNKIYSIFTQYPTNKKEK